MSRPDRIERFFAYQLPFMVVENLSEYMEHQGTITFDIGGSHWSFVFGCEEPIFPELKPDPELALTFTKPAFKGFLDGSLDLAEAVKSKAITAKGDDFDLLERFGRLLRPPSKNLGWDAR